MNKTTCLIGVWNNEQKLNEARSKPNLQVRLAFQHLPDHCYGQIVQAAIRKYSVNITILSAL